MKKIILLTIISLLATRAYADVTTQKNLVISVKSNKDGYCFAQYKTSDRKHSYLTKWECGGTGHTGENMLKIAMLAYITGQPTTLTFKNTGHGSSVGDDLIGIEVLSENNMP